MESTASTVNGESNDVSLATRRELFCLLSFLDGRLPTAAPIHSFVLSAILSRDPSFKVYYTRDAEQDVYLAILGIKNETIFDAKKQLHTIWLSSTWEHSNPHHLCRIYDAMTEINWRTDAMVSFGNGEVPDPIVLKHLQESNAKLTEDNGSPCFQYYIPIEEAMAIQIEIPEGVYVKSLERKHASLVYEKWTYKACTRVEHVADEIDQLPSAGVFLKENDELVSWMMSHPPNGMSRLHTLEAHRRKGYAKLLTRYLSKRFAQTGCIPFVNIVLDNQASINFFESLGFRLLGRQYVYVSVPPSITAAACEL